MKRCPRCGTRYESGAYCDQDGAALVEVEAPPARRRGRGRWLLAALAVLLVAALAAAPALVQRHVRVGAEVTLDDVVLPSGRSLLRPPEETDLISSILQGAVEIVGVVSGQTDLTVRLRVTNHTAFPGSLVAARYAIDLNGGEVGSGAWTAEAPIALRAGREIPLEIALAPDSTELLESVLRSAAGEGLAVRVAGRITLDLGWFGEVEVPFEVRRLGVELEGDERIY